MTFVLLTKLFLLSFLSIVLVSYGFKLKQIFDSLLRIYHNSPHHIYTKMNEYFLKSEHFTPLVAAHNKRKYIPLKSIHQLYTY